MWQPEQIIPTLQIWDSCQMELVNGQAEGRRPKPFPHLRSFSCWPQQAAQPSLHLSVQSELQPPPHLLHTLGPGPNPFQGAKCDSHAQTHTLCSVDFPLITLQVSVKTSPPRGSLPHPSARPVGTRLIILPMQPYFHTYCQSQPVIRPRCESLSPLEYKLDDKEPFSISAHH